MRALVVCLALTLTTTPWPALAQQLPEETAKPETADRRTTDPSAETGTFELKHMDPRVAVTLLRSILQTRQVIEISETRTVVVRDSPQIVSEAAALIAELDVPAPQWRIDLCTQTPAGERVLREVPIEDEQLTLSYGAADDGRINLSLRPGQPGGTEISVTYEFRSRIRYDPAVPPFAFSESGKATLGDGEQLELLKASQPGVDRALSVLLGQPDPASRLFLRFKRVN
jgi:hypothetical protein